jgi:hypothetical protein
VSSATVPPGCTCTEITLCDACASQQVETLNASTDADFVELRPGMLAQSEQAGVFSAVSGVAGWLSNLGGGQHGR